MNRLLTNLFLRWGPLAIFLVLLAIFGGLSSRFLSMENLRAILVQSSWLVVIAVGMNFALLAAGVDLSVGAVMYVVAVILGMDLTQAPVSICVLTAIFMGTLFGWMNAVFIVRMGVPAFLATLATTFVGRGLGLFLSSTQIAYAGALVARFGRTTLMGIPDPLWIMGLAVALAWIVLNRTPLGLYIRSIGADPESARRSGVPTKTVTYLTYIICGGFAGLAGFILLSLTSAASASFGQGCEFLAIAAAVLGGTSLFGGRGHLWAPVIGALLITMVQNGLIMIDANPYAYPVITGTVIFVAALFDTTRSRLLLRMERRLICPNGRGAKSASLQSQRVRG